MSTFKPYLSAIEAPSLADVQALPGLTLLEFGTEWCGHCRAAQALITKALADQPQWPGPCAGPQLPRQAVAHFGAVARRA
jgi:thiol-disulfide isomerase/thioredoxin